MRYELPKLEYTYEALEPYIDSQTMELHHSKHHAGYVSKLNDALEKHPELSYEKLEYLLLDIQSVPEDIRNVIKNNGNQAYNHNIFWKTLTPNKQEPKGKILELINISFGSFDTFRQEYTAKAQTLFGSGWVWVFLNNEGKLEIKQYTNEGNPLTEGTPLLPLDVWEHSYYLKYQNKRPEYIENWWNIINWNFLNNLLDKTVS